MCDHRKNCFEISYKQMLEKLIYNKNLKVDKRGKINRGSQVYIAEMFVLQYVIRKSNDISYK